MQESNSTRRIQVLRERATILGGRLRSVVHARSGQVRSALSSPALRSPSGLRSAVKARPGLAVGIAALAVTGTLAAGTAAIDGSAEKAAAAAATTAATTTAPDRQAAAGKADRAARAAATPKAAAPKAAAPAAPKATAKAAAPAKTATAKKAAWVTPMANFELSSCYGPRWGTQHQGIDFAADEGTPIRAVGAGTVVEAGWAYSGYGISVVIDHHNGYLTHYAHASATKVKVGQKVTAGQTIALEGSTGDSTGPHLHFEVHQGMWNQIEPASWLRAHGVKIGC